MLDTDQRTTAIFRAETVGSLLRPQYLMDARSRLEAGEITPNAYKRVEDRAVDEALALQTSCGLDVVSDGEMRRLIFVASLTDAIDGLDGPAPPPTHWHGREEYGTDDKLGLSLARSVSGKLRRRRSIAAEEYTYVRARATVPAKATLPSPMMLGKYWNPETSVEAYADPFDAIIDAARILEEEIRELARLGCEYVQIDATDIATLTDPAARQQYDGLGVGAERMLGEGVELLNSLAAVPGITFGIHLCKGNNSGRYIASGGYEGIAERVFPRLANYDVLLLEFDDERSGGFEPLAAVPDHQVVALGLVSTKIPELEPDEQIVARIQAATEHVPLERLAVSCQCGFASTVPGNLISPERQREKLELVGRVARRVWG